MHRKIFPLFLAIIGFLLLISSVGLILLQKDQENTSALPLPEKLAGIALTTSSFGAQALTEFSRMHNQNIPLQSGAMGIYGKNRQATIWASQANSVSTAEQLLLFMREKIALGNSPFQPLGEKEISAVTVYQLTGMGQSHFYFQIGTKVIWIAADESIAAEALEETIDFYR